MARHVLATLLLFVLLGAAAAALTPQFTTVKLSELQATSDAAATTANAASGGHGRRSLLLNPGGSQAAGSRKLDTSDSYWVFGRTGIRVISTSGVQMYSVHKDSVCRRFETCPTNVTSGGAGCTWGNDCNWGDVKTDNKKFVFATNTNDDSLVVFDMKTGILVASVPTCNFPYFIDLAEWRDEVYVHCWYPDADDNGGVIDVFSANAWTINHPLVAASFNPAGHVHGTVILDVAVPNFAYSTNLADPGVHKINLNDRSALSFINLTSVGCNSAGTMVISGVNLHGYLQCYRRDMSTFLVELDMSNDAVVHVHAGVSGAPVLTPDGKTLAVLNARAGLVHTLRVNKDGMADDGAVQDIRPAGFTAGGLSRMAFAQNPTTGATLALLTSTADNAVAVVNMDTFSVNLISLPVPPDGNSSSTQGHGASRAVAAALGSDGRLHALVGAARMRWLHVVDLGRSGNPSESSLVRTVEDIDAARIVFCPQVTASSSSSSGGSTAMSEGGSSQGGAAASGDSYKEVAVAALVLAAVAVAVVGFLLVDRVCSSRQQQLSSAVPCLPGGTAANYTRHEQDMVYMAPNKV
ncbi:hypothetical protein HYH02_014461 [Chlamydomonas schloesseri]|uniref:Methanethiol oxidase n=1 Tax=Chlamydomonas schloesseri TaxID=2026947 RepID=A0A835VWH0_9CHLO|nr:hypothetical protein HYH02_014461 [Chlamydomonas schloesseri]|eukprot:KAG2428069.1 hypothetical protein HYH02_014461 [Chlamydomonas schloesseri]